MIHFMYQCERWTKEKREGKKKESEVKSTVTVLLLTWLVKTEALNTKKQLHKRLFVFWPKQQIKVGGNWTQ